MPPKVKKNDAQEAAAATTVADGPLAALTPREQTILLQCLLTVPGFPAVSSHFIPSFSPVLIPSILPSLRDTLVFQPNTCVSSSV